MGLTMPKVGVVWMQTSRQRSRLPGFGLVDALVGLFLLVLTVAICFSNFSNLLTLGHRQEAKVEVLLDEANWESYGAWL